MKIGVIGGSFNPIHIGHLNLAYEAILRIGLDRVYFVVSARPPHKTGGDLLPFHHRYRMVEIACEDNDAFYPSDVEKDRSGPSYTIDTMRYFHKEFGDDVYFIVGQDAMEDVGSWHSASTLLKTCNFIVASRPGFDPSTLEDVLQSVLSVRYKNLKLESAGENDDGTIETIHVAGGGTKIYIVEITQLDISSTEIRSRLRNGASARYLVPPAVDEYLQKEVSF